MHATARDWSIVTNKWLKMRPRSTTWPPTQVSMSGQGRIHSALFTVATKVASSHSGGVARRKRHHTQDTDKTTRRDKYGHGVSDERLWDVYRLCSSQSSTDRCGKAESSDAAKCLNSSWLPNLTGSSRLIKMSIVYRQTVYYTNMNDMRGNAIDCCSAKETLSKS